MLLACAIAWTALVQHDPFFWDTVQLGSKHAHHFYENGLRWTALPTDIDSGHPPVFGYYIAAAWTLFGKTLPVGHWAMLPFLAGIALLLYRLGHRFGGPKYALLLVPVAFLDPVLAGQSALVGPDIPLAFFFLLAVEAFLGGNRWWAAVGVFGLCAISMRGMMTAGALFVWQVLLPVLADRRQMPQLLRTGLLFLPGAAFAAWFLWWHQHAAGWTGFHADSPWAPAFERARGASFLKNTLVLGWRWMDMGRVFEWAVLAVVVAAGGWCFFSKNATDATIRGHRSALALLFLCLVVFLSPAALLYQNLSAHRYFLPGFLALHLLVFHFLSTSDGTLQRKSALFLVLLLGLGTGNCWIYPQGISMDWDATLAHRSYHPLRAEMLYFIDQEKIPLEGIGTAFPNVNTGEHLLLNGDRRKMADKDFEQNSYMLISNVLNDFSKAEHSVLQREWTPLKRLESRGVWLELYQRPNK